MYADGAIEPSTGGVPRRSKYWQMMGHFSSQEVSSPAQLNDFVPVLSG